MNVKVKGIARYPRVMKPSDYQNDGNYRYTLELLIHKSDPQCQEISKMVEEVVKNGFPKGRAKGFKECWKDMAVESDSEQLKDYMCLKFATSAEHDKPQVVDNDKKPIMDPSLDAELPGQIVWVAGGLATYTKGTPGVKCFLNAVLVTGKMGDLPREVLSSKPSVEQMFDGIDEEDSNPTPFNSAAIPTPPAPPTTEKYQMTAKANGFTRQQLIDQGWSDQQLIEQGYMLPPNGITPSFV